jgi:leucyl/phenylalanyl-tRNA--protein transferase
MDRVRLDPESLLSAYAQGAFPMADRDGVIRLYTADPRGVIPLDERFHVPRTLRQAANKPPDRGGFELRINHDFAQTMRGCMAERRGDNWDGTWINDDLVAAYADLHRLGFAHSVECWRGGELAGGLYGVTLGGAFFGESMFHRQRDASKVALVHLVERLRAREFVLLDTQATTQHLRRFGCFDMPAQEYLCHLRGAITLDRAFD